jgi:KRAB domain-containing zinc finger protein
MEKVVFVDVIKQEEFKNDEAVKIDEPIPLEPEQAMTEFDHYFDDSFDYDSPDSEPQVFQPVTSSFARKIRSKEVKVVIPRLDPCSYENPQQKFFICDGCGDEFANRTTFMLHFRKFHKRNRINQCQICKQTFRYSNGLKVHQKYHENIKEFQCPLCPRRYVLKNEMKKHIQSHKCEDLAICSGCGKAFNANYLKKHQPNCKETATKEDILKAVADLQTEYGCDLCGLKTFGKAFLAKHMKRSHMVVASLPDDFECVKCDKVFKSRYDLLIHNRQVHKKKKVVSCEHCGRFFIKLRMLEIHQKSFACSVNHSKCHLCERVFKTKMGFENHQKKCSKEKIISKGIKKPRKKIDWICEFCGKHLTTQPGHRRHLIAHHKDVMYTKPPTQFKCPHSPCTKIFYYKFDLKNHIDCKHLKLRDFKCELCPKGYAVVSGLRRHMKRVHNRTAEEDESKKIFICHLCPLKYEKEKALSNHLMHHDLTLPDRPLHCLICIRSFKLRKNLNAHNRKKHPDQLLV